MPLAAQERPSRQSNHAMDNGVVNLPAQAAESKPVYLSVYGRSEARYVIRATRGPPSSHAGKLSMSRSGDGRSLVLSIDPKVPATRYMLYSAPGNVASFTVPCAVESLGTWLGEYDSDSQIFSGVITIPMLPHADTKVNVVAYAADGSVWAFSPLRVGDAAQEGTGGSHSNGSGDSGSGGGGIFGILFWLAFWFAIVALLVWLVIQWRAGRSPISKLLRPVRARLMPASDPSLIPRSRRELVNTELHSVGDCLYEPMLTAPLPPLPTTMGACGTNSAFTSATSEHPGSSHNGWSTSNGGSAPDTTSASVTPLVVAGASAIRKNRSDDPS